MRPRRGCRRKARPLGGTKCSLHGKSGLNHSHSEPSFMSYLHDVCSRFHAQCLLPAGSHYVGLDIRLRGFIV